MVDQSLWGSQFSDDAVNGPTEWQNVNSEKSNEKLISDSTSATMLRHTAGRVQNLVKIPIFVLAATAQVTKVALKASLLPITYITLSVLLAAGQEKEMKKLDSFRFQAIALDTVALSGLIGKIGIAALRVILSPPLSTAEQGIVASCKILIDIVILDFDLDESGKNTEQKESDDQHIMGNFIDSLRLVSGNARTTFQVMKRDYVAVLRLDHVVDLFPGLGEVQMDD